MLSLAVLLLPVAWAAAPAGLLPVIDASVRVPLSDAPDAPACREFAEGLVLCFSVPETPVRLALWRDLSTWKTPLPDVEAAALVNVAAGVRADRPAWTTVEGDTRRYLLSAEGDGLDQAAVFAPPVLQERLGSRSIAIGLPAAGVLVAFALGDPELEKILSVGVRRGWEGLEQPLSPTIYTWTGKTWVPWGEAKPSSTEVPCTTPSKP